MKWLPLIWKFPKWAIAAGIVAFTCLFFVGWLLTRGGGERREMASSQTSSTVPAFAVSDVVLAGNTLVDFRTGEIVAERWLEGYGDSPVGIRKVFADDRLVIVSGNGASAAFGFDGEAKKALESDGKSVGAAAFNRSLDEVVFFRAGDLWHGRVNWIEGQVNLPRRITDTGYFKPDTFRGRWLWHEGQLIVPMLGKTLQVNLSSGSTEELPVDLALLEHGMNPLGTFVVAPVKGRVLGVVDLLTGETRKHDLGQRIRKFLWLTPTKVAVHVGNNQVAHYDHELNRVERVLQLDDGIRDIIAPSPDGSSLLVIGGKGITVVDLKERKDATLKLPFDQTKWISDDGLLCSCEAIDTEKRGMWLVKKSGAMERLSSSPMDSMQGSISSVARTSTGALFVSGGNLWTFDSETKAVKQLTQGQRLVPQLQFLTRQADG